MTSDPKEIWVRMEECGGEWGITGTTDSAELVKMLSGGKEKFVRYILAADPAPRGQGPIRTTDQALDFLRGLAEGCDGEIRKDLLDSIEALEVSLAPPAWIRCDERMPDSLQTMHIYAPIWFTNSYGVHDAYFDAEQVCWVESVDRIPMRWDPEHVKHWMPRRIEKLPDPPVD